MQVLQKTGCVAFSSVHCLHVHVGLAEVRQILHRRFRVFLVVVWLQSGHIIVSSGLAGQHSVLDPLLLLLPSVAGPGCLASPILRAVWGSWRKVRVGLLAGCGLCRARGKQGRCAYHMFVRVL